MRIRVAVNPETTAVGREDEVNNFPSDILGQQILRRFCG